MNKESKERTRNTMLYNGKSQNLEVLGRKQEEKKFWDVYAHS